MGITAQIAAAADLSPDEKLFICDYCGCVWRRKLDLRTLAEYTIRLGQYDGMYSRNRFAPDDALQRAIEARSKSNSGQ